jgi:DNA primase catalytic subunit
MHKGLYYKNKLPHAFIHSLASLHANGRPENVEFALEFDDSSNCRFNRYLSCATTQDVAKLASGSTAIAAVHMGATYSGASYTARNNRTRVPPMGKALVFDLDLQDMPPLTIDKGDMARNDQWMPAVFGMARVLKAALSHAYGYEHFLCVYSGRRGCHLWVLDQRAFAASDQVRSAVVSSLCAAPHSIDKRVYATQGGLANNPTFEDAIAVMERVWLDTIVAPRHAGGCGLLDTKSAVERFLEMVCDPAAERTADRKHKCAGHLAEAKALLRGKTGAAAYAALATSAVGSLFKFRLLSIRMAYCWPAIDVAASNKLDHLTKIPFSVHGSSGRVALPVDLDAPLASGGVPAVPRVSWESLVVTPDAASIATFDALVDYAQRTVDAAAGPPPSNNTSMTSMDMDIEDLAGPQVPPSIAGKRARV